jgi:hypothetical protein
MGVLGMSHYPCTGSSASRSTCFSGLSLLGRLRHDLQDHLSGGVLCTLQLRSTSGAFPGGDFDPAHQPHFVWRRGKWRHRLYLAWLRCLFRLNLGSKPFASLVFNLGNVGMSVEILAQRIRGTTAGSLNGTAATFKVVSNTYLTPAVPSGATTGFVTGRLPSAP